MYSNSFRQALLRHRRNFRAMTYHLAAKWHQSFTEKFMKMTLTLKVFPIYKKRCKLVQTIPEYNPTKFHCKHPARSQQVRFQKLTPC